MTYLFPFPLTFVLKKSGVNIITTNGNARKLNSIAKSI